QVNSIPATLCYSAETPRYIETLPRRGYRFIAPVYITAVDESSPTGPLQQEVSNHHSQGIQELQTRPRMEMRLALLATSAITAIVVWALKPAPQARLQPVSRVVVALPPETTLNLDPISLAISPDGTYLAYAAVREGTSQLHLRTLDQLEGKLIPGS